MINTNMIEFDGIGALNVTFASELTSKDEGKVIKISDNKTIALSAAGEPIHGKTIKIEKDGAVVAQVKGCIQVPYTGTTVPKAGDCKLVADGKGGVKVDDAAVKEYLVLSVDTTNKIVGILL